MHLAAHLAEIIAVVSAGVVYGTDAFTPLTRCVRGISAARMARSHRFRCATATPTAGTR
jgi:hypothetical protein